MKLFLSNLCPSKWPVLLLLIAPLFLSSCASSVRPKALDQIYGAYEQNRTDYYRAQINKLDVAAAASNPGTRNDVINDLVLLIDHNYGKIENSLYNSKAWSDFGGSLISTGLGTAATLTGAAGAKTTLSALVTAIDSTKVSFSKDVLQGQSMIAIIAQMRKLRAEKLVDIRKSMALSVDKYPLSQALDDLMEYYQDGTFVTALQSMTEDAAASKKAADNELKDLKGSYSFTDDSVTLRNYWKPNGVVNAAHAAQLKSWLAANEPGVDIVSFIYSSQFASDRSKAVAAVVNGNAPAPKPAAGATTAPKTAPASSPAGVSRTADAAPLPENTSTALRDYWKPGGTVNTAHAASLKAWLANNHINTDIATFIDSSQYESERTRAVAELLH